MDPDDATLLGVASMDDGRIEEDMVTPRSTLPIRIADEDKRAPERYSTYNMSNWNVSSFIRVDHLA